MEGDKRGPSTSTSRYWIMVETTAMQVMLEGEKGCGGLPTRLFLGWDLDGLHCGSFGLNMSVRIRGAWGL